MSIENREQEIKILEAELKELRDELIAVAKEIKECKDGTTRKALFADKKSIQADIDEAKKHLALLKGEDVSMPTDELEQIINNTLVETIDDEPKNENENDEQ